LFLQLFDPRLGQARANWISLVLLLEGWRVTDMMCAMGLGWCMPNVNPVK
jgi:hypothetical protein